MSIWRFLRRKQADEDLDEEIQVHLSMATRYLIESGDDPRTAEEAARR